MITSLATILAAAAPTATSQPAAPKPFFVDLLQNPLYLMMALLVVVYFVMIRSKRNQDKQRKDMLSQLKKGDRIQTIGGILGTVVEARETEVVVKVDETSNAKIRFVRSAIHRVTDEERPPAK